MVVPPRPRPRPPPPPSSRPPPPPSSSRPGGGGVEEDDKRHKREEAERRKRRKAAHLNKSEAQREKDRKIKEHRQRVLREKNKQYSSSSSSSKPPSHGHKHSKSSQQSSQQQQQQQQQQDHSAFAALFADRTGGFVMEFKFRNAPPRPPVGPCFVGLGLEGELQESWTKYVPNNSVERNFAWKLHAEPDLGVPLAPSAMDWHGCYTTTEQEQEEKKELDKEDDEILNWKGSMGDSAADELQSKREQARRADAAQQSATSSTTTNSTASSLLKLKKRGQHSRVLEETRQFWMKKTTYLDNDRTKRVHDFRSLAQTKQEAFVAIDAKLKHTTHKLTHVDTISNSFQLPQQQSIQHPTRPHLIPLYTYSLLPDVSTWGHDFYNHTCGSRSTTQTTLKTNT